MPIFDRGAPITVLPSGYQPELDRLPPSSGAGCWRTLLLILLFIGILAGIVIGVIALVSSSQQVEEVLPTPTETLTPTATATLDAWSLTGTAIIENGPLFTPTPDYCWFLTPPPTMTPVPIHTLDSWSIAGTAIFLQTQTPTHTPQPRHETPRSWCDHIPTSTAEVIFDETWTPAPSSTATPAPTNTPRFVYPTAEDYGAPVLPPTVQSQYQQPPQYQPTFAPPTLVPPQASATRTPTPTITLTITPAETATDVPTETVTSTPSATETPTEIPTVTPTFTPTLAPYIQIFVAHCAGGYPVFGIQNIGALPGEPVFWEIIAEQHGMAANGYWQLELSPFALLETGLPAWANIPGTYTLRIFSGWDTATPEISATALCQPIIMPTVTENPTIAPEATEES